MKEIHYYLAEDGTKFDDRWDCMRYERQKQLEECKDDFQFFDYDRRPIALEDATTENVYYIVVNTNRAAEVVGNWFTDDCCVDPFDGFYEECIGTWVYKDDEWLKLELEIEKLQTLLNEINQ